MKPRAVRGTADAALFAAAVTQQHMPRSPFDRSLAAHWTSQQPKLVLRLANGSGKSNQMANFTSALHLLKIWSENSSERKSSRHDVHTWLRQGRALARPLTILHSAAWLKPRFNKQLARRVKAFELPRSFALDMPRESAEPLATRDEARTYVQMGSGKTWASISPLAQRLDAATQVDRGLALDAAKLNGSLALFRSVDGLWSQLQTVVRLADVAAAPPPSSPLAQPLAIACGVRRLSVPLIPRAPGPCLPGLALVARDDCGRAAPTGSVRAA